ncbi:hypothetical protein FHS95_002807 [Sphingomonas naasensis]|uniref:Uncharacterized protein n=1 Tax=Sphingomonas naasensis TaxID=1344951 RepID=A0A4S1WA54_9SPHN|nr:hypothetical protein [Sphingomonas naasensis]NIJ21104.1 hypothetical protein [Sphingomonas naasensis]TGX38307.1 hypothetical protein E5A74_19085 [Sphingomonas naasensis]
MSRPRRHRLHSLGLSASSARPAAVRARFRDDGFTVRAQGPRPAMLAALPPPVRTLSVEPADWGWPAAEPSTLSWPDAGEAAASAFSVPLGEAPAPQPGWPDPAPAYKAPAGPLDDAETEDDVAAILRDNGLAPIAPQLIAAPAAPAAPAPAAEEPAPPAEDRHAIFGQLGRAMSHANSFQLGRFNFDRHFDMLEEGMALHPVAPEPVVALSSPRELHDLDLLSELAAMSEAAGVPLRRDADSDTFLARVARAQGLQAQALTSDDESSLAEEEEDTEEAFDSLDAEPEENAHSPWSDSQDEAEAEDE